MPRSRTADQPLLSHGHEILLEETVRDVQSQELQCRGCTINRFGLFVLDFCFVKLTISCWTSWILEAHLVLIRSDRQKKKKKKYGLQ